MKKVLALLLAISATWTPSLVAQHAQEKFSSYAPAERILNLDDLKSQLKQYHSCTCKCGCTSPGPDLPNPGRSYANKVAFVSRV